MNYSDYFDKIYIITYVKNIDKRENICKELKRIGINDYEFAYSYNTSVINNPNNIDNNVLSISFTHYDIIKKSYELGMEHILIFEDDVMFLKNVSEIHDLIKYNENLNYDINFYDYQYRLTDDDKIIQIFLASAYSLNRQGMKFFISNFESSSFVIDGYITLYKNDYHTIPNIPIYYMDKNYHINIIESDNTTVNLSSKRICVQNNKFEIYNDNHGNTCNIDEYNLEIKKSANCIIIIPLYKDYLWEYEEISLKQCINILSKNHDILFIHPVSLDIFNLFNTYNIDISGIKNNINCIDYIYDDMWFASIDNFNSLLCSDFLYYVLKDNNYVYMLLYELDGFVFYDNLQYWIDKDYDYIGSFAFDAFHYNSETDKDKLLNDLNLRKENNLPYSTDKYLMNGGVSLFKIQYYIDIFNNIHPSHINSNTWHDHLLSLYSINDVKFPKPIDTFDFCWSYNYNKSYVLNNFKLPMFLHYYQENKKYYDICKEKFHSHTHDNKL